MIGKETTDAQLAEAMQRFRPLLEKGLDVAFVVRKGALSYDGKVKYQNDYPLKREETPRLNIKNEVEKVIEFLCDNNIIRREQGKQGSCGVLCIPPPCPGLD